MKQLFVKFIYGVNICLLFSTILDAKLTTLRHFDPAPNYSANDSMMPPNSQFITLQHARIKEEQPSKRRWFGFNMSGFFQKAVQARGYTGSTSYGTVVGSAPNAFEMGDFRGTLYAMGLFLGHNPKNGKTIVNIDPTTNEPYPDTDPCNYITPESVEAFDLPPCLSNIALGLIGNAGTANCTTTATGNPLIFFTNGQVPQTTQTIFESFSIFSPRKLAEDTIYFGAFSLPIEYQQVGARFELNIQPHDNIGLTIQTGFTNMRQYYVNTLTTGSSATPSGQTNYGPYPISAVLGTSNTVTNLYGAQLNQSNSSNSTASATAQSIFNQYISNNIAAVLNPDCIDNNNPICNFDRFSVDDLRLLLTLSKSYEPFRARHDEDDDPGSWPDTIFTPYTWIGGSVPIAKETNYRNILALPFGNDGHGSVGGGLGFTFDFAESVEVGFEGGVTYFIPHVQTRPFPTHQLQRILYPFEATVTSKPGMNWEFKALLHAYQFLKHVSFWFTYELIEHTRDCYSFKDASKAQYYTPEVLTCRSDWRAQFFNAAMVFDIMPGLQLSFLWQQPIAPRNAYYPVTLMGSINFLF